MLVRLDGLESHDIEQIIRINQNFLKIVKISNVFKFKTSSVHVWPREPLVAQFQTMDSSKQVLVRLDGHESHDIEQIIRIN